jgi:CubicO group peptidase (beta-lactamase class C family)
MKSAALALLASAAALQGCALERPIRVATGHVAHVLCAETFVAGRDPDVVFRDYIARMPVLDRMAPQLRYVVDRKAREVTATFAGGFAMRAAFADGRGCTVVHSSARPSPISLGDESGFAPDPLQAPPGAVTPADPRIAAAIARAVAEPGGQVYADTKALVVVHDGRIVGEWYAPGYGPQTPMLSWSVAKSPINALVGVLVREGKLKLEASAPIAAWADPADPRHAVTLEQLVRQTSGQPFGSSNSGFDRSSQMQFLYPDTAAYAEAASFQGKPGARWSYTDANYAILSQIVRDQAGGTARDVARFAHRELFGPLGMTTMTMEFDEAGAPMGATYMLASARDWARFGLLYADDGVIGGRRILPEGWVDWSARQTPQAPVGYGAGFWTNRGDDANTRRRIAIGAPADSFFASGNFDQTILVSPAERLVIARFGFAQDPDQRYGAMTVSRLAGEVLAALKSPSEVAANDRG